MRGASYDAIVIGTGQSGPYVTSRLAAAGMKVAVIERKVFGGTCVNTGCIPTKTMVASAYAARVAARCRGTGAPASRIAARNRARYRGAPMRTQCWTRRARGSRKHCDATSRILVTLRMGPRSNSRSLTPSKKGV